MHRAVIETLGSLTRASGHDIYEQRDMGNLADARVGSAVYNLLSAGASS